ncbi:MAG: NAD-dependent epimerase/dehydratase family protein [Tatlockia sp.]|nr:NAD-dependent epimerase/dehydratase family protein [Tatlockia sp.]
MKKVLVTGGNGFIGSHLVSHLLSLGKEVLVLDKSIHKPTFCDIHKAQFIEGDILSTGLIHECLKEVDTCFHLAAIASIPICARDWIFSHEINVLAFNGLLEELKNMDRPITLVYASSSAVYGDSKALPLSESERVIPHSTYGGDKLSNEIYAEVMSHLYGIHSIGLRLFNVYGPGQMASSSYSGVITRFKNAIKENQTIKIYGDGKQTRDFIYIDDTVEAFLAAAESATNKSGLFNVCTGRSLSILELANLMMDFMESRVPIIYEKAREGDLYHSVGDGCLAKKELGFNAHTSIETGLTSFLKQTL